MSLRSRYRSDDRLGAKLFRRRHPDATTRVLGRALSATLLVGFEEILRRQRARSVPGGVADSAGIGIQSRCRFARERRWAHATASSDRQTGCASGGNEAL